jgi:hypothetical protein|tara:strand:- start:127 stop:285 length:159 start_codon:yes stop_codon:yes gene_type:complete
MNFRNWCYEKWQEHKEEVCQWEGRYPIATGQEYFAKYRWWLKRQFLADNPRD